MGFFDFLKTDSSSDKFSINLTDLKFVSDDHVRYQNGQDVTGHNKGCWRGIRVQTNILGGQGYTVTIYNLDGNHPIWDNNIQMAPKQMKIISQDDSSIKLKGYGVDATGFSFADYGLTIYFSDCHVDRVTLHMYDRQVYIKYFKASEQTQNSARTSDNDFDSFKQFVASWNNSIPMNKKLEIAVKSDSLNDMGTVSHNSGNTDKAIEFYKQALLVMPNNDDALNNLRNCYSEQGKHLKMAEVKQKLDYIQRFS